MQTKLTIDQRGLKNALAVLATVVPSKASLPILCDVLLKYDSEKRMFSLVASDGEKWLALECRNNEDEPFVTLLDDDRKDAFHGVCLNFKDLREAIALLPAGQLLQVTLDDNHTMTVDYQLGRFQLPWEESTDFPDIPTGTGVVLQASLEAAKLLPWMKQSRSCVASDELRPVMETVCLDVSHEGITVVATDGHALYRKTLDMGVGSGWLQQASFGATESQKVLVHKSALQAIDAAFATAETITITADTQRVAWQSEGTKMVCRLFEGRYPNYSSVIPQDNPHKIDVDARSMASALRRLSLFANDSSNMATICRDGNTLILEAEDVDFSKRGNERVPLLNAADTSLPDGFRMGFKISKMVDLLALVSTDVAQLHLSDPMRAALIKEDSAKQDLTLLIMPMALTD